MQLLLVRIPQKEEIISAVRAFSPDYVAMSVTNPYNLVVTKKITDALKETFPTLKGHFRRTSLPKLSYQY